ncbi:MAG: DUF1080 domain-containing protein [Chlorobi bacterium]|nr:DUF1080 domain-containing protein [Chlorobiota bacterium]
MLLFTLNACETPDQDWTSLLDKNLSQWEMYLSYSHKPGYHGKMPLDENGDTIPPIGYNRNVNNVFSVIEENGGPVLRISGEIYGCVFTRREYDNYDLKLKVRWGNKKWDPRKDKLMDSGILYHSIGECGLDYWRSWMRSQEFQVMEGHMGDYWSGRNTAMDIRAFIPEGIMNPVASEKQPFISLGTGTQYDGFCLRSEDHESPDGEWTELELICFNGKSLHIVNGRVVMVLQDSRYLENGKTIPLTKGKIQLQSEAAEVFYKDIRIRPIESLPAQFKTYFE